MQRFFWAIIALLLSVQALHAQSLDITIHVDEDGRITGSVQRRPDPGGENGTPDPAVPVLSETADRSILVKIPSTTADTLVHLRTKEADLLVGSIPAGKTELLITQFGETPLNAGWEYWARTQIQDKVSDEQVIQLRAEPTPPPPEPGDAVPFPADGIIKQPGTYTGSVTNAQIRIAAGVQGVNVVNATFTNSQLTIGGGGNAGIRVENCVFKGFRHRGGDNRAAIYQTTYTRDLVIRRNRFEDSNAWGVVLYGAEGVVIEDNVFTGLHQGGHILGPVDVVFRRNHLEQLDRMGLEVQDAGSLQVRRLLVEANTVVNWRAPFNDSFGLSIIPENTTNGVVVVQSNYIQATRSGDWYPNREKRFGYGIEIGGHGSIVQGNWIIAGKEQFVAGVATSSVPAAQIIGNRFYGPTPAWGWFFRQPGRNGVGQYVEKGNVIDPDVNNAPKR